MTFGNSLADATGVHAVEARTASANAARRESIGFAGLMVAWTVTYQGGAKLSQYYPNLPEIGVVRLDAACTAPSTICNP